MRGKNLAIVMGHVGADPNVRTTQGGTKVARVRMATNRSFKDKDTGEWREVPEWHRIVAFGRLATVVEERVSKGDPLYVEGRMNTRKWSDGKGIDRWTTEVVADDIQLMPVRGRVAKEASPDEEPEPEPEPFDDDIPF